MKTTIASVLGIAALTCVLAVPATAEAGMTPKARKAMFKPFVAKGIVPVGKIKVTPFKGGPMMKKAAVAVPELSSDGVVGASALLLGAMLLMSQRRRRALA